MRRSAEVAVALGSAVLLVAGAVAGTWHLGSDAAPDVAGGGRDSGGPAIVDMADGGARGGGVTATLRQP